MKRTMKYSFIFFLKNGYIRKSDTIVNKGVNKDRSLIRYGRKFVKTPSSIIEIIINSIDIIISPSKLLHNEYR